MATRKGRSSSRRKSRSATLYAKRASRGRRFKDMDETARSRKADRRMKAKRTVRFEYGDQGDQQRRPRAA